MSYVLNPVWAKFVRDGLRASGLRRYQLADRVDRDASSVTLWTRGHVPRRATVLRIGAVFGAEQRACLAAGILHPDMREMLQNPHDGLSAKSRALVRMLGQLTPREQDRLTYSLRLALGQVEAVSG